MPGRRLEQQYLRLLASLAPGDNPITLQQLADTLCCSKRHMRALLVQMQAAGWLEWQATAGRGHKARLRLLCNQQQLLMIKAEQLVKSGDLNGAITLLDAEKQLIARVLQSKMGYHVRDDYQSLCVPYYRTMPNLYPGTPLRRSEVHLVRQIFNGLTRSNPLSGMVESDLAHRWRNPDPLRWIFYLRPGVRFHHGGQLTSRDVVASLSRCRQLPLFSHLKQVVAQGALCVMIELTEPEPQLPQLLTDPAALILPADHAMRPDFASRPSGSGPYQVIDNNHWHLLIRAYGDYFGLRGLLDEVEIIVWPEDSDWQNKQQFSPNSAAWLSSSLSDIAYVSGRSSALTGKPSDALPEMFLERGGYFLLCDQRSSYWQSIERRRWIREKLHPYLLLQQLVASIRPLWVPASSLLPDWFHCIDDGPVTSPFDTEGAHPVLRLAYHSQHPEYPMLVAEMRKLLAAEGVQLQLTELDYQQWARGEAEVDLWLGTVNFAVPEEWNVGAWLLGMPLLKQAIFAGDEPRFTRWQQQWRAGTLSAQQMLGQVVGEGWLQPLFHHWMRLKGPEQAQGIHLNNLGWFDFNTSWMEPGLP